MSSDPFSVTLKTAVNTRAPLRDRVPSPKHRDDIVPATSALHRGIHTTYDAAYSSVPTRSDASDGNHYLTLLRSHRSNGNGNSSNNSNNNGTMMGKPTGIMVNNNNNNNKKQEEEEKKQEELLIPSLSQTGKNDTSHLISVRHEPRDWETIQQLSTREVRPTAIRDFYSTARKIERADDDRRGGLVGNTQRTVDIMRKRAQDPLLTPPTDVFSTMHRVQIPCETDKHGHLARSCLDIVDCTQLQAGTEGEYAFEVAPLIRLSDANINPTMAAVKETMERSTAPDIAKMMLKEATRSRTTAPPVDTMYNNNTTNTTTMKTTTTTTTTTMNMNMNMTMNSSSNNNNNNTTISTVVEIPQALKVQERIITRMGTTRPLFAGTAKVQENALPLYTGHVPSHPHNIAMQHGNDNDPVRVWSKSYMTLAVHGGGVDSSSSSKNPLVRRRAGTRSKPAKALPPKSDAAIESTVEGSMLHATFTAVTPAEQAMNQRVRERSTLFS